MLHAHTAYLLRDERALNQVFIALMRAQGEAETESRGFTPIHFRFGNLVRGVG